jgi:hypothetical protein
LAHLVGDWMAARSTVLIGGVVADFVTWLRGLAEKGGKGVVNNIDARCLGRIADDLERLQNRAKFQTEMIERRDTALRRIASLDEKNVPKYAQQIVREFYASVGISPPVGSAGTP